MNATENLRRNMNRDINDRLSISQRERMERVGQRTAQLMATRREILLGVKSLKVASWAN